MGAQLETVPFPEWTAMPGLTEGRNGDRGFTCVPCAFSCHRAPLARVAGTHRLGCQPTMSAHITRSMT